MTTFAYRALVACAACLWAAPGWATSVLYDDPAGGWLYSFEGSGTAFGSGAGVADSLDGTWVRGGSSDSWDGSGLGGVFDTVTNDPGGIESLSDGGANYLRIQDTGDPRSQSAALGYTVADPSNRKIYLVHPLDLPGDALETGITIAFRIRIATTGVLDPQYPSTAGPGENSAVPGGTAWVPNGGLNADDGKGFIGLHGAISGSVSFSPALENDRHNTGALFGASALSMNNLNGTTAIKEVDPWTLEGGTTNMLPVIDWSQWHEFWITIAASTAAAGTHHVEIFADGAFTPVSFDLTVGTGQEGGASTTQNYLAMGFENSAQMGAADVDYVAVKAGVLVPTPEPGSGALLAAAAMLTMHRRPRRAQLFAGERHEATAGFDAMH